MPRKRKSKGSPSIDQNAWQIGYRAGKTDKLPEYPPGLEDEQAFFDGFCAGQADRQNKARPGSKVHLLASRLGRPISAP